MEENNIVKATFTETAEEEVEKLIEDLQVASAFDELKNNPSISPELKRKMLGLVAMFADLFSAKLPDIVDNDLDATLEVASRDINLSRLLRERGLFRIFRLIKMKKEDNITPIYIGMISPITGEPFRRMEDLISFFCEASHVSRSLVFSRLNTIENCMGIGMTLEKAFKTIISKPYAITETLRMIGDWEHGELVNVNEDIAQKIVAKFGTPKEPEAISFDNLEDADKQQEIKASNYTKQEMNDALVSLLDEVASHDRVKDVLDFVRHDVLKKPEVTYRWDKETDALIVELVRKEVAENGSEFVSEVLSIPFYPDIQGALPQEIRADLIKRLPISNRSIRKEI